MVLVYSRRCLEVIITDLSERELKRPRGTEPLKGIIDKLNKEEKVPNNIIVSMQNLNSLSTFGAHPRDFDPRQVKPVILDLTTVLEWYLKYMEDQEPVEGEPGAIQKKRKEPAGLRKKLVTPLKSIIQASAVVLICAVIAVVLILTDVISGGKQIRAGSIGSIIVLPFENYTGVDSLEYFVSGMHSSLIQDMGKIGNLHIPGTTTSKVYKNADKTIAQITSELHVDAALETDVLCLGKDTICFQTRLIKPGKEEEQLWIADYKVPRSQILNWYNRVTKQIAEEVKVKLTPREESLLAESKTVNNEAYDAYLKGLYYWDQFTPEALELALEYFNKAIEIDPEWAPAHAAIAYYWIAIRQIGLAPNSVTIPKIYESLNEASRLDPNSSFVLYVNALASVWTGFNWEKGEKEFLFLLEIDPNDAFARAYYAHLLMLLKRDDEAIDQGQLAADMDPLNPMIQSLYAMALAYMDVPDRAIQYAEKAISLAPDNLPALSALSIANIYKKDYKKSLEYWLQFSPVNENNRNIILNLFIEQGFDAAIKRYAEEVEKIGMLNPLDLATLYALAGDHAKAMDLVEKGYDDQNANIPYIGSNCFKEGPFMIDDPRLETLLIKMNLPLK